ncbi:hypothetical protein M9H77_26601 [Catharanthus roseus]|uniref:Uncharacterized protein n=1 Tax=Catharanthus roseus TaxID=4058 RepID=A0ACC0AA58_CATRO|nr:hypothetical protein M9H77_26601 [Catharanthus roseus]
MAYSKDEQVYPLPQSYRHGGGDDRESTTMESSSQDLRNNKSMKCYLYFIAFLVFQTAIILLFALTIMKIRTPKFRIRSATLEILALRRTPENPSFNFRMNAEIGVKNNNFGDYKFQNSKIYFYYKGSLVGEAIVGESKAGIRATKYISVVVDLLSSRNSQLAGDLNSGILKLKIESKLSGKVELIKILKKKKFTCMDCTLTIGVADRKAIIREMSCK